ncbi:NAD(P)H-dependent oxidoreductase [Shewanella insulae]|uniref:NADPH-dependent FMN reductase n=1 Tax=Shewanella insulae TaxID=2681496 RepID=UPI001EFDE591|nr:NAD(P)H-dependent oxidoreductase [Shewanella insulae]MCG9711492.1 NAD(P)H-dependent oxidoreductase [Shewanella insulae]MCG9756801.1 NAD(P)H-dependent oxidoreductase [Shewanella insulae]
MKLLIVSASQRPASQSARIAGYLSEHANQFSDIQHIELCRYDLPFWDGDINGAALKASDWHRIAPLVEQSDALILITPEWGGMASPMLKNFLLLCDNQATAHKPALLVAVSSGISGAYPIAELKMNALKNNKLVPTPDHLIIRNVEQVLGDGEIDAREQGLRERIGYSLHMLGQYADALGAIRQRHREQPYPKQQEYVYGM